MVSDPSLAVGPDGRARCAWASTEDYRAYHDHEWGRPVRDDRGLYERVTLEGFQSGLSWLTILRKREAFRAAFAGFDPLVVAGFSDADVDRLLADPGIVCNRAKIVAAVGGARATLALGPGGLAALVWRHQPPPRPARLPSLAAVPATTPASVALAAALRAAGYRFVGPTTAYALMQACGLVDDHVAGCHVPPGQPPASTQRAAGG